MRIFAFYKVISDNNEDKINNQNITSENHLIIQIQASFNNKEKIREVIGERKEKRKKKRIELRKGRGEGRRRKKRKKEAEYYLRSSPAKPGLSATKPECDNITSNLQKLQNAMFFCKNIEWHSGNEISKMQTVGNSGGQSIQFC